MKHKIAEIECVGEVYAERNFTRRVPSVDEVARLIERAAALEPMVEY